MDANFQTSLALHTYDHWGLIRNRIIFEQVRSAGCDRHMMDGKWNWESNIDTPFDDVCNALYATFSIAQSENWVIHPNMTFVMLERATNSVVDLKIQEDRADYVIFGNERASVKKTEELLISILKKFKLSSTSSNKICAFRFHHHTPEGIESRTRDLEAVGLAELKNNYTQEVFTQVENLVSLQDPYKAGKIILYHGPPGNGKTHLLRGIAYEWFKKFDVQPEVIIDPEPLFEQPGYLMELLTLSERSDKKPKFRFIIAEDCANLFGGACRENAGFGRLLNVVDGLLGSGQKLIFLFTANEHIDEIDPAILRPGRCLQHLHIPDWSQKDAAAWLTNKGFGNKVGALGKTNSLADLYAIVNDLDIYTNRKGQFGFNS